LKKRKNLISKVKTTIKNTLLLGIKSKKTYFVIFVILLTTLITIDNQIDDLKKEFFEVSQNNIQTNVSSQVSVIEGVLTSLGSFYQASDKVSSSSFSTISKDLISTYPYISTVVFVKNIDHEDRKEFEEDMQYEGIYNFTITQYDEVNQKFINANQRKKYLPIIVIEPSSHENTKFFGYDLNDYKTLSNKLPEIAKNKNVAIYKLKKFLEDSSSYLFVKATYYGFGVPESEEERIKQNSGYFILRVTKENLLKSAKHSYPKYNISLKNTKISDDKSDVFSLSSFLYVQKIGDFEDGYLHIKKEIFIKDINFLNLLIVNLIVIGLIIFILSLVEKYIIAIRNIKKNELQLRNVFELSPIALCISSLDCSEVLFSNPAYLKLLESEDATHFNSNKKVHYLDFKEYKNISEKIAQKESVFAKQIKLQIDDEIKTVLASYIPFEFNKQDGMLAWFVDITTQISQQEQINHRKNELQAMFDVSKDGIAIIDLESNFLEFNDAYLELTGYSREELLETSCLLLTPSDMFETSKDAISTVLRDGYIRDFEKPCIKKDGTKIYTSMSIALMPTGDKLLASVKDITKNKVFEEQAKLASMGEMIGNIAHQWRQPLSVITTIASGIQVRHEFGIVQYDTICENMDKIIKQANYLSQTIDDFRNFIQNSHEHKDVSICDIVNKTLTIVSSTITAHRIKMVINLQDDKIIRGHENELIQALMNVINNAKDAMIEHVEVQSDRYVFIDTRKYGADLVLTVKDSGGGIPEDIMNRIFEPYFTTKHKSIGTGIGLDMAYKIITNKHDALIKALNVEYEYEDKNLKGACFEIRFLDK